MKKILFYINAIHHGGAERVICNLATRFSEQGYDCVLVTSFRDEWEYVYGDGVKRITLFEKKLDTFFLKRNIALVKKLRHVLKSERPDVLVSFMAEPNFRAIIASIGLKNKVVVSVRNDPDREYPHVSTKMLAKFLFRKADGIVFQTDDAKKWFPKPIQRRAEIIFNQVDEVFYCTTYEGVRHDIVTTGRLVAQKNQKMLMCAFSSIANQVADNLIIYGEGELRGDLEALIAKLHMEKRIFLPGSIKNVAETIKSAKLFVLSSDYEGMPNALMEALAVGVPSISTDCPCGGPAMLIEHEKNGLLVPVGDEDALADAMGRLLTDKEYAESLGAAAKESAKRYMPEKVFSEWEKFVNKVLENEKKAF